MSLEKTLRLSPMTSEALWKGLGLELERIRLRQGYPSTYALYTRHRDKAPAYNTLNDIEAGRPGYAESVTSYCDVLGVKLTDALRHVLGMGPGIDSDALRIALWWQDERTDPALRAGVLAIVGLQEAATGGARAQSRPPATAPPAVAADTPKAAPAPAPAIRAKGTGGKRRG